MLRRKTCSKKKNACRLNQKAVMMIRLISDTSENYIPSAIRTVNENFGRVTLLGCNTLVVNLYL